MENIFVVLYKKEKIYEHFNRVDCKEIAKVCLEIIQ